MQKSRTKIDAALCEIPGECLLSGAGDGYRLESPFQGYTNPGVLNIHAVVATLGIQVV